MRNNPDIAYYYPAPYWEIGESAWIKSLLLFFDQVAILLPNYMHGRHQAADPTLVEPLEERGLLRVLEPADWIDEDMAKTLAEIVSGLLREGVFDDIPEADYFAELSQARLGYAANFELADNLVSELKGRGLARPSEDGVSVPLHPAVRTTVLVILGQLSRTVGPERGFNIHPTTNCQYAVAELVATLARDSMPSRGKVISLDLEPAGLRLDSVPLDEILAYRSEHAESYTAYIRNLHRFMVELAQVEDPKDRELLLLQRRQEIADIANDLRFSASKAFCKNLATCSLGLAGGAWSVTSGDPIGALLAGLGLLAGFPGSSRTVTAYTYLFELQRSFAT